MRVRTETRLLKINILGWMYPAKNHEYLYFETVRHVPGYPPGTAAAL